MKARTWRLFGLLSLAAAVAAAAAGVAFAATTLNGSGTGSGSTATISLHLKTGGRTCAFANLEPGDLTGSAAHTCTLTVSYLGTVPAWMSLSILVETEAGAGAGRRPLYDPVANSGLTMTIADNQNPNVHYATPTAAVACPAGTPAGSHCYAANYDLVSAHPFKSTSPVVTFTVSPSFATSVGNPYQGGTAKVLLTAHAVQTAANPLPTACNASTVGKPCPPKGSFAWS